MPDEEILYFRHEKTGKIYKGTKEQVKEQFERDQELGSAADIAATLGSGPAAKSELTPQDKFYNFPGRFIPGAMTAVGSVLGGVVGSRVGRPDLGSAVGAGAGSATAKMFQTLLPEYLGEYTKMTQNPAQVPYDVAGDVAEDWAFNKAARGAGYVMFPSARQQKLQTLAGKWYGGKLDPEQMTALAADPNFRLSLGQANPDTLANTLEKSFASSTRADLEREQTNYIARDLRRHIYAPEDVVWAAQQNAIPNVAAQKAKSKGLYQKLEPYKLANSADVRIQTGTQASQTLGPNGQPVQIPVFSTERIEGAIPLKQSANFADQLTGDLRAVVNRTLTAPSTGSGIGFAGEELLDELGKISKIRGGVNPATNLPYADPIISLDRAKKMVNDIDDFLGSNVDNAIKSRLHGTLDALRKTLRNDIEKGVEGWGPQAYRVHRRAQDYYKGMNKRLNSKMADDLMKAGKDPETTYTMIARDALSDPQKTRQFISTSGDPASVQKLFLNDVVQNSWDASGKRFDAGKMQQLLWDQRYVAKEAVNKQVLESTGRLLERAKLIGRHSENANTSLKLWLAKGGVNLAVGSGLLAAGQGYGLTPLLAGGTLLLGVGAANKFMKMIVNDKNMSRVALKLLTADPKTPVAKFGTRALLGAMKGMQATYRAPDGIETQVFVNDKGKIEKVPLPGRSEIPVYSEPPRPSPFGNR